MLKILDKKIFYYILIAVIFIFAFYLRTKHYLAAYPLWTDEQLLVQSIVQQDIFQPLIHIFGTQKAPPLFVFFNYLLTSLFGLNELTLRLVSYISSLLALIAFYILSAKLFKSKIPILTAFIIFAFNHPIIYYTVEFKQYSFDLLVCILLLLCYKYINFDDIKNFFSKKTFLYSLIVFLVLMSSFPAAFIIPAIFLVKIAEEKKFPKGLFAIILSVLISYIYLAYMFKHIISYEITIEIWTKGFIDFSLNGFLGVFNQFINYMGFNGAIFTIFLFSGILLFIFQKSTYRSLILSVFFFACIASLCHIYPISERAALYFIPICILFIVKPLDVISSLTKQERFLSIVKSLILVCVIISNYTFIGLNDNILFWKNIEERTNHRNDYLNFLKDYKKGDELIANIEFESWLKYYSKSRKYNYEFNTYINQYEPEQTHDEFMLKLKTYLMENNLKKNIWLAFDIDNETISEQIENLLKELNLNYKKINSKTRYNIIFLVYPNSDIL